MSGAVPQVTGSTGCEELWFSKNERSAVALFSAACVYYRLFNLPGVFCAMSQFHPPARAMYLPSQTMGAWTPCSVHSSIVWTLSSVE